MEVKVGSLIFLEEKDREAQNVENTNVDLIVMELKK